MADESRGAAPDLLETGVPNLDRILGGGLLARSLAMAIGTPGTGKTLMAQQIAFHNAAQGAAVLYLTGFSETHDKLLSHSRNLTFFAPDLIGSRLQFGSLPDLLGKGSEETVDAIVRPRAARTRSWSSSTGSAACAGISPTIKPRRIFCTPWAPNSLC
jgi:circadian clock protein KaiC